MTDKQSTSNPQSTVRRALGRGIETLLPPRLAPAQATPVAADPAVSEAGKPREIPVTSIERNPFQTRSSFDPAKLSELSRSIAANGVVQPIVVRPIAGDRFQLIAGERRWLASREAGNATIPAVLRNVSDAQAMEMTIVENLQRADLNPMEQARAYQRLSGDFRMTQEQIAVRTGKERASVANFLRLLRLPAAIQEKVESGELSFGHARTLLGLQSPDQIAAAAQKVLASSMSVRQTETFVHGLMNPESKTKRAAKVKEPLDPNVNEARQLMERKLGLRVHIEDRHGKGRVIIDYGNLDDFDLLVSIFDARPGD